MEGSARFRVNSPSVIGESVDGELLIVNLESGAYFSARGSGDAIWSALEAGCSVAEVAAALTSLPGADGASADAVDRFVSELVAEKLIVAGADRPPAPGTMLTASAYVAPTLEKFTDMQELLVLDPVHEVDEAGWPHARPDLAAAGAAAAP